MWALVLRRFVATCSRVILGLLLTEMIGQQMRSFPVRGRGRNLFAREGNVLYFLVALSGEGKGSRLRKVRVEATGDRGRDHASRGSPPVRVRKDSRPALAMRMRAWFHVDLPRREGPAWPKKLSLGGPDRASTIIYQMQRFPLASAKVFRAALRCRGSRASGPATPGGIGWIVQGFAVLVRDCAKRAAMGAMEGPCRRGCCRPACTESAPRHEEKTPASNRRSIPLGRAPFRRQSAGGFGLDGPLPGFGMWRTRFQGSC